MLTGHIHQIQSKFLTVAAEPLEIVDETPNGVTLHVAFIDHKCVQHLVQMVSQVLDTFGVMQFSVIGPAIFRDPDLGIVVLPLYPSVKGDNIKYSAVSTRDRIASTLP